MKEGAVTMGRRLRGIVLEYCPYFITLPALPGSPERLPPSVSVLYFPN